jgi:hypothetical protein
MVYREAAFKKKLELCALSIINCPVAETRAGRPSRREERIEVTFADHASSFDTRALDSSMW